MTFEAWRTLVKIAYQGGEPSEAALLRAVTDGARAVTVRDVESDLALAKSYRDSFRDAKVALAGARITDNVATVVLAVRELMPIDDDTLAIEDMLENAITTAYDDVNGMADRWDALLIEAAVELQRHVAFFQSRHESTYLDGTTGLVSEAYISRVAPPAGMRLEQMFFGRYIAPLAEGTAYVADDQVESNGRIYINVVGGTLSAGQLADGLASTNYDDEALGALTFQYARPVILVPARPYPWVDRARLRAGRSSDGALYSLSPQSDQLWFYPALTDGDHRFVMEWVGMQDSFADSDEVTFDAKAAACAAHLIRSHLIRELLGDSRKSMEAFALFQRELRGLVVDNEQREQGMTGQIAAYNYWGSCFAGCQAVRISTGGNAAAAASTTGGISLTITSLDLLAAMSTVAVTPPAFITFWNESLEMLVTYRLVENPPAESRPGIVWPLDHDPVTNDKGWISAA